MWTDNFTANQMTHSIIVIWVTYVKHSPAVQHCLFFFVLVVCCSVLKTIKRRVLWWQKRLLLTFYDKLFSQFCLSFCVYGPRAYLGTFIYWQIEWNMLPRPIKNFEALEMFLLDPTVIELNSVGLARRCLGQCQSVPISISPPTDTVRSSSCPVDLYQRLLPKTARKSA